MKNILIIVAVALGGAYFYGNRQASSLIDSMYQQCASSAGNKQNPYCSCKHQVMKQEVNPIQYFINGRKESYRIISVSTSRCASKLNY